MYILLFHSAENSRKYVCVFRLTRKRPIFYKLQAERNLIHIYTYYLHVVYHKIQSLHFFRTFTSVVVLKKLFRSTSLPTLIFAKNLSQFKRLAACGTSGVFIGPFLSLVAYQIEYCMSQSYSAQHYTDNKHAKSARLRQTWNSLKVR